MQLYVVVMAAIIVMSPASLAYKISCGIVCWIIGAACYFHIKHLLIPDVDYGVVRCLRRYNALAIALSVLSILEMIALACKVDILLYVFGVWLCVVTLALVPVMDRGGEEIDNLTVIPFMYTPQLVSICKLLFSRKETAQASAEGVDKA